MAPPTTNTLWKNCDTIHIRIPQKNHGGTPFAPYSKQQSAKPLPPSATTPICRTFGKTAVA
ncbi:MAG: hypothetical protein IJO54_01960 [Oscillospiraceae bacterium]|nr:hypothetical protein [Oscillospiraceae bacterium]